jgi:hypothetical protein
MEEDDDVPQFAAGVPAFAREVNHNPDSFWESTGSTVWSLVMDPVGFHFDTIDRADVEADNSIAMMSLFVDRCRSHPPVSLFTKRPYGIESLTKTLMKAISLFKVQFGHLIVGNAPEMFPQHDVSIWKKLLKNNHSRVLMEGADESAFLKDTYPIPRCHSPATVMLPASDFPDDARRNASRKIDMVSLSTRLFATERFTDLLKVLLTFNGIGRAGEVKFLTYATMFFCLTYNIMFCQWFQRKTLKTNPSGFGNEFTFPELCVMFLFGCFWAIDRGLARENIGEPFSSRRRTSLYVFQSLHGIRDSSVAKQITAIIKSLCPTQLKPFFTGKSLRYGAMTLLSWDPAVTYEEAIALGGWSTGCNADYYVWMYLVAIIPAVMALAGYPDVRMIPYLPDVAVIFTLPEQQRCTPDQWSSFVGSLYVVQLPQFQIGGNLRDFLVSVTVTMVMHFDHCYQKYGGQHSYCRKMINSAIVAGMAPDVSTAVKKLTLWSTTIKADFVLNNTQGTIGRNDMVRRRTIPDQLDRMNAKVAEMLRSKTSMLASLVENRQKLSNLEVTVAHANTSLQIVSEQNDAILTNQRLLLFQNQIICQKLGVPASAGPVTEDSLRGLLDNLPAVGVGLPLAGLPALPMAVPPAVALQRSVMAAAVTPAVPPAVSQQCLPEAPQRYLHVARTRVNGNAAVARAPVDQARLGGAIIGRVDINDALLRPRTKNITGTRGITLSSESMKSIIKTMYELPKNCQLRGVLSGAAPYLADQSSFVHMHILNGKARAGPKITLALQFWDALWTEPERHAICSQTGGKCANFSLIEKISRRVVVAKHLLSNVDVPPATLEPSGNAKDAVQGVGNGMNRFNARNNIEQFIPRWRIDGQPIPKGVTLWSKVEDRKEEVKAILNAAGVSAMPRRSTRR